MAPKLELNDPFPIAEYEDRVARLHAAMDQEGLDAVLIHAQESMFYLYNYDQLGYWIYQTVVVPRRGEPVALVRIADLYLARQSVLIKDVRTWADDSEKDPAEIAVDILAESGTLSGRRVGLETRTAALKPAFYDSLKRRLESTGAVPVEASDLIIGLRLVKSPAEVECMRKGGEIYDLTSRAIFDAMQPGVRECDAAVAGYQAMLTAGSVHCAMPLLVVAGPNTMTITHYAYSRRVMERGDPATIELGGCWNRYHAVGCVSAAVGDSTATQRQLYAKIRRTVDAGRAVIGPGVPTAEVARAMLATIDGKTRGELEGVHFGYGIGIGFQGDGWVDNLRIKTTDKHVLEPGMTFFVLHTAFSDDEDLFYLDGEPILVTEDGFEDLSKLSHDELRVVGI